MNKYKNILLLFVILVLAFLLRIWCLDKPQGLWNDEYVSWFISSRTFPTEFFTEMFKNAHMPLYYFFLKVWMFFFSDSDYSLRFSSLVLGLLSVVSMFFLGKTFKDEKLGLLCAVFSAFSGFLIYFSQEVRLYQLLFLLSTLSIISWINISRKQSFINFAIFIVLNFLLIFTHTLGFIFVIFNSLTLSIVILKQNKKLWIHLGLTWIFVSIILLVASPLIARIFNVEYFSQFWSGFSCGKIFFTFADYYSPIQVNIINTPQSLVGYVFRANNIMYLIFGIIPLTIGFIGIVRAVKEKETELNYLLISSLLFLLTLICASIQNKLVLETKYSVEIYPVLILATCFGLYSIKRLFLKKLLIVLLLIIPIFHYVVNRNSVPKLGRSEGNKVVIQLLRAAKIKPTDIVFLTYYPKDKFDKYLSGDSYKFIAIDKYNFPEYVFGGTHSYKQVVKRGKQLYYNGFQENNTEYFNTRIYDIYVKNLKPGDRLAVVFLKNVSFFSAKQIKEITSDRNKYEKTPLMFMVFSYIRNNSLQLFSKYLKLDLILECDDWVLVVFEKQ